MAGLWGLTGTAGAQTPPSAAPLTAEDFARDPDMSAPQVSPDGTHVAWVRAHQVIVFDRNSGAEHVLPVPDNRLDDAVWVNNDYFVVNVRTDKKERDKRVKETLYSPLVLTKDAKFVRLLLQHGDKPLLREDLKPIVGYTDGPSPKAITLGPANIFTTDVVTGANKIGLPPMAGGHHFFDHNGEERMVSQAWDGKANYGVTDELIYYRATPGGDVRTVALPKRDHIFYENARYAEADNAIYWWQFDSTQGQTSIVRFDMATAAKTVIKTSDNKTIGVVLDKTGHLVGFDTESDRDVVEWTDPFRLKLTAAVRTLFPKAGVDIVDISRDGKTVVILVSAPDAPDSYYLYDITEKTLDRIGTAYPQLDDKPLGEMTYVTYKARDGLDIPAYVIKRKDTPPHAPLIVMPHGGPADRDDYGFDFMAQFFASRGYVVLLPQYRGSSGFGDAFQHAGDKHLAQMTTDLEDGVHFLQAQGLIDPAKVCVVGWSWGGYLADAALAFTPKTYACGVSGDGVSDLYEQLTDNDDDSWNGYSMDYWRGLIGGPILDARMIHATSPVEHVADIQAPLLLIHGTKDAVVDKQQSERMNGAMLKAGKKVTYLPVLYMHHGPETEDERLTVLKAMDGFIADAFKTTR